MLVCRLQWTVICYQWWWSQSNVHMCVSGFRPRFLERRRSPSDSGAALISTRHLQLYLSLSLSVCFPHPSVHSHDCIFIKLLWYWLWNTGCRINELSCLMSEKRGFDPSENEMHFRSAFLFNEGSWRVPVLAFCGVLVPMTVILLDWLELLCHNQLS